MEHRFCDKIIKWKNYRTMFFDNNDIYELLDDLLFVCGCKYAKIWKDIVSINNTGKRTSAVKYYLYTIVGDYDNYYENDVSYEKYTSGVYCRGKSRIHTRLKLNPKQFIYYFVNWHCFYQTN